MTREASVRSAKRIDRFPPLFLEIPPALTLLSLEILFFHKNKWIKQRVKTNIARKENTRKATEDLCSMMPGLRLCKPHLMSLRHLSSGEILSTEAPAGGWPVGGERNVLGEVRSASGCRAPPLVWSPVIWLWLLASQPQDAPQGMPCPPGLCLNHARHLPGRLGAPSVTVCRVPAGRGGCCLQITRLWVTSICTFCSASLPSLV